MCAEHNIKRRKMTFLYYLIAISFAIVSGFSDIGFLHQLGNFITDVFIRIFKCISLPIIALSLIVTISTSIAEGIMNKMWRRTITYTIGTTIIAATVSSVLYFIIKPSNIDNFEKLQNIEQSSSDNSYFRHILNIFPENILYPFLEHQVLGVLLVGIVLGIAIHSISNDETRRVTTEFFRGMHSIFMVMTKWVVKLIPLALFGFITTTIIQLRSDVNILGIGKYLAIIVLSNLVQGFIILPLWLYWNKIKPFATMKAMMPALSVAFLSKSSTGTLPITIETAEKNLGVDPKVSRFALPLCTTINMNGCAAFIFTTVLYLMQNNGIEITVTTMLLWIMIATIAAIGNAGVPMGCFFLSASLLASMNIPITLLGIILPFYGIIDMVETALNVWSDSCVAKVLDKEIKADVI